MTNTSLVTNRVRPKTRLKTAPFTRYAIGIGGATHPGASAAVMPATTKARDCTFVLDKKCFFAAVSLPSGAGMRHDGSMSIHTSLIEQLSIRYT